MSLSADSTLEDAIKVLKERQLQMNPVVEGPEMPDAKYWRDLVARLGAEAESKVAPSPPRQRDKANAAVAKFVEPEPEVVYFESDDSEDNSPSGDAIAGGTRQPSKRGASKHIAEAQAEPSISNTDRQMAIRKLAQELHIPYATLKAACGIFDKYAQDGYEIKQKARLSMTDFMKVLDDLCMAGSSADLPEEYVEKACKTADRDNGGDIDLEEYAIWYATHCFDEELALTAEELAMRKLSRSLGVSVVEVEKYKKVFTQYDTDGSGQIDYAEFTQIIVQVLKVPEGHELPKERIDTFWSEADTDGSGEVEFEEFVTFYVKYFEKCLDDPLAGYYRGFRVMGMPR